MANPILEYDFVDKKNLNAESGINNGIKKEASNELVDKYNKADCETVISHPNNAWIVLGRDRYGGWETGYGGRGHDRCGAIDIVAGRVSGGDLAALEGKVNPSVWADASRIYLSQKADIDDYYKLAPGRTGMSKAKAAIVLKSDDVRIIARNSLKLVTSTESKLSPNDSAIMASGVQLIANNNDKGMQPIPKGDNLVECLTAVLVKLNELAGIVKGLKEIQSDFNAAMTMHTHISPFFGMATSPPVGDAFKEGIKSSLSMYSKIEASINSYSNNLLAQVKNVYLGPSAKYINSEYHFLN